MRSRAQLDADRLVDKTAPSLIRTQETPNEVTCGECNRSLFIDDESVAAAQRRIEHGGEATFICDDCRLALEEPAIT